MDWKLLATVMPSIKIAFGKLKLNKQKGTATLTVPMVDPEIVKQLRALKALGWVPLPYSR